MVWRGSVLGFRVQRDPELDLHVPAGDAYFLKEQPQELLFLFGAEVVHRGGDSSGESLNAAVDFVVAAEFSSLGGEVVASAGEVFAAVFDMGGALLHSGVCEQPGLVEVREGRRSSSAAVILRSRRVSSAARSSSSGVGVRAATACSPARRVSGLSRAVRMRSKT
jgi:hypothetical protein